MRWLVIFLFVISCSSIKKDTPEEKTIYFSGLNSIVGLHEISDRKTLKNLLGVDPVQYEWCAAFVNLILNYHEIPGSESVSDSPLLARSFMQWGTEVVIPKRGDVVILKRGNYSWQGHVGFYYETIVENDKKYYVILGGNQNDSISYEKFPVKSVVSIRRWQIIKEEDA